MEAVTLRPLGADGAAGRRCPVVELHLGSQCLRVPAAHEPEAGELWLPDTVFDHFPLSPGQTIGLWPAPEAGRFHLGPLVCVLLGADFGWDVGRGIDDRLRLLHSGAAQAQVPLCFAAIHDLDPRSGWAQVISDRGGGRWERCVAPLPDVIYNRATYPDPAERQAAAAARRVLRRVLAVPLINPVAGLNKWDTYQALRFFPACRALVPETIRLADRESFCTLLARHGAVFAKADSSSYGDNGLRIAAPRGLALQYRLQGYLDGWATREAFWTAGALYDYLQQRCQGGLWLVQQAVDLLATRGRVFDFRVVMQKDGHGQWQLPHLVVRLAPRGSVVTNTSKGGDSFYADPFAAHWEGSPEQWAQVVAGVEQASRLAALALEAQHGLLGELGLDVGVDRGGRAYLLEANAKPFMDPGEGSHYPFLYARHLAMSVWASRAGARHWQEAAGGVSRRTGDRMAAGNGDRA